MIAGIVYTRRIATDRPSVGTTASRWAGEGENRGSYGRRKWEAYWIGRELAGEVGRQI